MAFPETTSIGDGIRLEARGGLRGLLRGRLDRPAWWRLLQAWRIASAPREFVVRRHAASAAVQARAPAARIDRERGFARIEGGSLAGLDSLLTRCGALLERARPRIAAAMDAHGGRLRLGLDLCHDKLLAREPELVLFAIQDALLLPVVEYLRTFPYLDRLSLRYARCVPGRTGAEHYQRFHVDDDDFRHVKAYVHLRDVGPDDGPLTFLPADVSARVLLGLSREGRPRRLAGTWSDAEVFRHCDPGEMVSLLGPPGTCTLVDLSRCLHYGSRVAPGRERFVLVANWLRYHRLRHTGSSQIDPEGQDADPARRLALAAPVRHQRGTFCPDVLGIG